jgi:hypothetical protein
MPISRKRIFLQDTKHVVLENEYFKRGGVPLGNFGNPYF